jgi:hypothetical protein
MLASVGQMSTSVSTQRWGSTPRTMRSSALSSDQTQIGFGQQRDSAELQIGFGNNTISAGAAALHTLDSGMQMARQVVPTMEELREQFSERKQELEQSQQKVAEREKIIAQVGFGPAQSDKGTRLMGSAGTSAIGTLVSKNAVLGSRQERAAYQPLEKTTATQAVLAPAASTTTTTALNVFA